MPALEPVGLLLGSAGMLGLQAKYDSAGESHYLWASVRFLEEEVASEHSALKEAKY